MTGYTVHTGSTEKFSAGWDRVFENSKRKKAARQKAASSKARPSTAGRPNKKK